jgi:hypothetical protein
MLMRIGLGASITARELAQKKDIGELKTSKPVTTETKKKR